MSSFPILSLIPIDSCNPPKTHFLDIVSLEIGQISSDLLKKAFSKWQQALLSMSTTFYDIFARACAFVEKVSYIFRLLVFKIFFFDFSFSPFVKFLEQWLTFYWACFQCKKFWESIKLAPCSINSIYIRRSLRGPAPKKRPMTSGSKIESADFYLSSRGYWILFVSVSL